MGEHLNKILRSFDSGKGGFSARKLTAFSMNAVMIYLHFRWVDHDNIVSVLIVDASFIALLLGIVTAEQIIALRNGDRSETNV
jgi:hypothetical protein